MILIWWKHGSHGGKRKRISLCIAWKGGWSGKTCKRKG